MLFWSHKILWVSVFLYQLEHLSVALSSQAHRRLSSTEGRLSPKVIATVNKSCEKELLAKFVNKSCEWEFLTKVVMKSFKLKLQTNVMNKRWVKKKLWTKSCEHKLWTVSVNKGLEQKLWTSVVNKSYKQKLRAKDVVTTMTKFLTIFYQQKNLK